MKREDVVRRIRENGGVFVRHGGRHDWYTNPKTGMSQPVPRHTDINEQLARHTLKKLQ